MFWLPGPKNSNTTARIVAIHGPTPTRRMITRSRVATAT